MNGRVQAFARVQWCGAWLLASAAVVSSAAAAEAPQVEFDLAHALSCEEVTTEEFAALHPDEKVIQVTFRVSVRVTAGKEEDLQELIFDITSPEQRLRILDFDPAIELESETTGEVEISKTSETINTLGAAVGGTVHTPPGPVSGHLTPSANLGSTKREAVTETVTKLSPKKAILTSGTTNQGYGVFFKLKRSLQGSFEGTHTFTCRMIVPCDWAGDWVLVACQARGTRTRYFINKSVELCGQSTAFVGLYLAGEPRAKAAAFRLAQLQGPAVLRALATSPSPDPFTTAISQLVSSSSESNRMAQHTKRLEAARLALARFAGAWPSSQQASAATTRR